MKHLLSARGQLPKNRLLLLQHLLHNRAYMMNWLKAKRSLQMTKKRMKMINFNLIRCTQEEKEQLEDSPGWSISDQSSEKSKPNSRSWRPNAGELKNRESKPRWPLGTSNSQSKYNKQQTK